MSYDMAIHESDLRPDPVYPFVPHPEQEPIFDYVLIISVTSLAAQPRSSGQILVEIEGATMRSLFWQASDVCEPFHAM